MKQREFFTIRTALNFLYFAQKEQPAQIYAMAEECIQQGTGLSWSLPLRYEDIEKNIFVSAFIHCKHCWCAGPLVNQTTQYPQLPPFKAVSLISSFGKLMWILLVITSAMDRFSYSKMLCALMLITWILRVCHILEQWLKSSSRRWLTSAALLSYSSITNVASEKLLLCTLSKPKFW